MLEKANDDDDWDDNDAGDDAGDSTDSGDGTRRNAPHDLEDTGNEEKHEEKGNSMLNMNV